MPKAEKEFILNYAMNRWQLNFKKNVGPTSDSIRICSPKTLAEWRDYYYTNMYPAKHLDDLGRALFLHISKDLPVEDRFHPVLLQSITEEDCFRSIPEDSYGFAKYIMNSNNTRLIEEQLQALKEIMNALDTNKYTNISERKNLDFLFNKKYHEQFCHHPLKPFHHLRNTPKLSPDTG